MKMFPIRHTTPLALGATLLAGSSLHAQAAPEKPAGDLRARTQGRVQSLVKVAVNRAGDLELTTSQKTKLRALAQKNQPLLKAIWSDDSLSKNEKITKVRALEAQASAILTPAQKRKVAAARSEAMGQFFQTAMWVSKELNLSTKQQGQLQAIVMDTYQKSSGSQGDIGALRNLIVDTSGKVDKVLTPAQQAKWTIIKTTARQELVRQTRTWRQMNRA